MNPRNFGDDWTTISGGTLYSRVWSPGTKACPVVLLIPGMGLSGRYMVPLAEQLSPENRVHALDLPGYGKSFKPPDVLDLTETADALAEWMDAKNFTRADLIGHSFGSQIAVEFALRHAERADRLVFLAPTVDPAARSLGKQLWRQVINSTREPASLGWIVMGDYWAAGIRRIWATARIALSDAVEVKLPYIQSPALLVRGEKDPVVPQGWAEKAAESMPHGELCVIRGAAHLLISSHPKETAGVIRPFLSTSGRKADIP